MNTQKLSLPTDERNALISGLVTDLLWHGKIETTLAQAKAASRIADRCITIAINACEDVISEEKLQLTVRVKKQRLLLLRMVLKSLLLVES